VNVTTNLLVLATRSYLSWDARGRASCLTPPILSVIFKSSWFNLKSANCGCIIRTSSVKEIAETNPSFHNLASTIGEYSVRTIYILYLFTLVLILCLTLLFDKQSLIINQGVKLELVYVISTREPCYVYWDTVEITCVIYIFLLQFSSIVCVILLIIYSTPTNLLYFPKNTSKFLGNYKLKLKLSHYTPRRRFGGEENSSSSFSISALDGGEWSAPRPCRALAPGKGLRYPLFRRLGGPQSRSGHRNYTKLLRANSFLM
jgi:hypothetical protein